MKYNNFEDVPVWQDGIKLTVQTFALTREVAFRGQGDIANQIQRASLSVPNNIAEGFDRGTTAELLTFLYYAKGSAGEVRSICYVMERLAVLGHLKSDISDLKSLARSISKQLGGWAFSLQESDILGSRHLTDKGRQAYDADKRATAFMEDIKREHEERLRRLNEERQQK